ncbi:MAG TPA: hypothetical protein VI168_09135 [Croceibacterium sp.]
MGNLFYFAGKIVSTLLGVAMVCFGGIWILQGLGIAFQVGFMAGDPQWAVNGAILALVGIVQAAWSVTRRR